ncbi:hypothetical protein J3Q64DRAFT_1693072 [Phycomyces blakesleeanus]|uniref:Homeodomain-like DNA binding domain-containing transcription factor n=1 Tax=Phycomyces blakesleeanus TaxID=4837 RepID=A0ABR3BCP6_PHYBL
MHNPRLRDNVSTVKASSPLSGTTRKPAITATTTANTTNSSSSTSPDHVDQILVQVRRQIERWGEHARWHINLVLLDPPNSKPGSPLPHKGLSPVPQKNSSPGGDTGARLQSLFQTQYGTGAGSPQPPALSIFGGGATGTHSPWCILIDISVVCICALCFYLKWEYSIPSTSYSYTRPNLDDAQQKLQDAYDRQHHLESIVQSQADQMKLLGDHPHDTEKAIETMRTVYLMTENEQKLRHALETRMLQTEIDTLARKLRRVGTTLRTVENIELSAEETSMDSKCLLEERKLMMRKLHLAELRLSARDAELDYLHETLRAYNAHAAHHEPPISRQSPTLQKQFRKGPPYLFQQQYSPKIRSDLRPPAQQSHLMSGLDSLGILADQMLSNPDFEKKETQGDTIAGKNTSTDLETDTDTNFAQSSPTTWSIPAEPRHFDLKRSKRSIDSANTLVAMPSLAITSSDGRENDLALRQAVDGLGTNQWEKVAATIPNKTLQQCRQRWSDLCFQLSSPPQPQPQPPPPLSLSLSLSLPQSSLPENFSPSLSSRPFNARRTPSIAALLDSNEDMQMRQNNYSFRLGSPLSRHETNPSYCRSPPHPPQGTGHIQERP